MPVLTFDVQRGDLYLVESSKPCVTARESCTFLMKYTNAKKSSKRAKHSLSSLMIKL